MENLSFINYILITIFAAFSCYQMLYLVIKIFSKHKKYAALKMNRYAVVVSARNESLVIGQLIESVKKQDYPAELIDIYVVADNCTDNTAEIARQAGATVYERFNKQLVGKGYALSYLFHLIKTEHADTQYDGYFIFDADNLLDGSYITEMNKVFSNGYPAVTSYRNTKNYGDNWITASYGLWFLRESEYLNNPRSIIGVSCAVSGTGFLFSDELLEQGGGWNYHLMTEDLEFTADLITNGGKIGYAPDAVLYDEQPRSFRQSIVQRSRWMKGSLQVMSKYAGRLLKGVLKNGSFSCYDMLMGVIPSLVIFVLAFVLNTVMFIFGMVTARNEMGIFFQSVLTGIVNSYLMVFLTGFVVVISEWKRIQCKGWKKIVYSFGYPFFVLTFIISMLLAVFTNIEWKPIKHTAALSISDIGKKKTLKKERL